MAYAAVISLKHTIDRLLNTSNTLLVSSSTEIMQFAYKELESLQEILKRLDRSSNSSSRRLNALDGYVREAARKMEDVIESCMSDQFLSQSEGSIYEYPIQFSIDLQDIEQKVLSFTETLKRLEEDYIEELNNLNEEEEEEEEEEGGGEGEGEEDEAFSSKSKMVGLSDEFRETKNQLTRQWALGLRVCSIVGMVGIGKTTVAKRIYEDPSILRHFNCRAAVTVGRNFQLKKITQDILAQVSSDSNEVLSEGDYQKIAQHLKESLKGRRFLIVLDDVWETRVWRDLESLFPDDENGSRVLLTTTLEEVALDASRSKFGVFKMRLLNKVESWELFCEKMFGEARRCPSELEKVGEKIVENCEGLPLMIVTVANLMPKSQATLKYWNEVAEKKNSVFMNAYDQISKVLSPSYEYLPQHLKVCFLYMGVFPEKYEIPTSKLINMWIAEGFLARNPSNTLEDSSAQYLEDLVSRNLVMIHKLGLNNEIKKCGLHTVYWHFSNKEAGNIKFFHVMNKESSAKGIQSQRRLCIHNNILFSMKDVRDSMKSNLIARSLLCTGAHHQYPVPICFDFTLLKVLDALTIRFYKFPDAVVKLVQLRYLAFTYNGKLDPSISKLRKLQFLIVYQLFSIQSSEDPSRLPKEIYNMKELKHLQIMGRDLPISSNAHLPNLLTLLDVSASSCKKEVLEIIPNLEKLGIRIELAPNAAEPSFDHISCLHRLESLKCSIVNPELRPIVAAPHASLSNLPISLKKLSLSGLGYTWEEMSKIALLPKLEVLKLRRYAFRGAKWEIEKKGFLRLKFLLIEDTDLVQWKVGHGSFPCLRFLSIKHCYKLKELHWESIRYYLEKIEIVDCNRDAMTYVEQIKEDRQREGYRVDGVSIQSSWGDGNES